MKIQTMRRFSKTSRLQADSVPQVTRPFEKVSVGLSDEITFDGGKLRPGHVLNALIHVFNEMPARERAALAAEAVARLEVLLAENDDERARAAERIPHRATGQPWLPGSVRDQTPLLDPPKPRKPSHVNETRVDPDRPKSGKRNGAS
jgi:hypothetical protein